MTSPYSEIVGFITIVEVTFIQINVWYEAKMKKKMFVVKNS